MTSVEETARINDVIVWLDPGGGITIKTVGPHGDPTELSSAEAHRPAQCLLELAAEDDA